MVLLLASLAVVGAPAAGMELTVTALVIKAESFKGDRT
jgi:hypothetical protein